MKNSEITSSEISAELENAKSVFNKFLQKMNPDSISNEEADAIEKVADAVTDGDFYDLRDALGDYALDYIADICEDQPDWWSALYDYVREHIMIGEMAGKLHGPEAKNQPA